MLLNSSFAVAQCFPKVHNTQEDHQAVEFPIAIWLTQKIILKTSFRFRVIRTLHYVTNEEKGFKNYNLLKTINTFNKIIILQIFVDYDHTNQLKRLLR